ncbi:hypothetical protein P4J17_27240, partial [Bacillus cereus]|nr:hypothetical protein [Bacillus cereus]
MVNVLIQMKLSMLKHSMNRGRAVLFIMTGLVGLLLAIGTILLFSFYPTEQTISKSILYVTFAIWALGWIIGPMLTGGDGILRPEYFVLLPLNSYKLARMLLGVTFIGVGPLVSFLAFIGLLIYAARISIYAIVVAVPAIILQLVFVVLLSKVIVSIMGEAMKSRVGMEMGAMFIGFIIAFLNVGWYALPVINRIIFTDTVLLYMMPSSWTILAVEYASQSNWLLTSVFLSAITIFCGLLLFIWTTLLTRSTVRDSKKIQSEITKKHYRKVFKIFFETKIGAIITRWCLHE